MARARATVFPIRLWFRGAREAAALEAARRRCRGAGWRWRHRLPRPQVTTCSFCGKTSRDVGPMVEGPSDVYICANCTDLCQNIFKQERGGSRPRRDVPDHPTPRSIKEYLDQYVIGQDRAARPLGGGAHALQAVAALGEARDQHRTGREQHHAHRAHRLGQDAPGPHAGADPERAVRHRRCDDADRGRLCGRGRREPAAETAAGRGLRPRGRAAGHHLHRRDRQDRQDLAQRLDHARRVGRGRAAVAAEDARGHGRERASAGRAQAPRAAVHSDGHLAHPVHLRRHVRGDRGHHPPPRGQEAHRFRAARRHAQRGGRKGRGAEPGDARRRDRVRDDPRTGGPPAGDRPADAADRGRDGQRC